MTLAVKIAEDNEYINKAIQGFNEAGNDDDVEQFFKLITELVPYNGKIATYRDKLVEQAQEAISDQGTEKYLDDVHNLNSTLFEMENYLNTSWRQFKEEPLHYLKFELEGE